MLQRFSYCCFVCVLLLTFVGRAFPMSDPSQGAVITNGIRLVKFSGTLHDSLGTVKVGVTGVTFAIYEKPDSVSSIWLETQNVNADETGRFTVLLGSTTAEGLPSTVFAEGEGRWLGVRLQQEGEQEQPRTMLVSVPYAIRSTVADDSAKLGGRPVADFVLTPSAQRASRSDNSKASPEVTANLPLSTGTSDGISGFLARFESASAVVNSSLFESNTNIGLGTQSPIAKLDVLGQIASSSVGTNNYVLNSAGINYGFLSNQSPGVWSAGFGPSVSALATPVLSWTGTGRVGVGTTAPASKMDVNGTVLSSVVGSNNFAINSAGPNYGFISNPTPGVWSLGYGSSLNSLANPVINWNAGGNVGIGTTVPAAKVDVNGSIYSSIQTGNSFALNSPGVNFGFVSNQGSDSWSLGYGRSIASLGTSVLSWNSTGNVGIGTNVPQAKLDVNGPLYSSLQANNSFVMNSSGVNFGFVSNLAADSWALGYGRSMTTLGTPVLSWNNFGNVGIGITSPSAKLDVSQNISGAGSFSIGAPPPSAIHGDVTASSGFISGVFGTTSSTDGFGVLGENLASGQGTGHSAGVRGITANTTDKGTGVWGDALQLSGDNVGVFGHSASNAGTGVQGLADSATGDAIGVYGRSDSTGGTGVFGEVTAGTAASASLFPAGVYGKIASNAGAAGLFDTTSTGSILLGRAGANAAPVFRVDSTGKGFFNGATQTGGADFAESVSVLEDRAAYQPGDVMAIDITGVRRFTKVSKPYSTLVAGIYSTKPGVLATPHAIDDPRPETLEIPLAMVGIVPCKVTNENGIIVAGDLLVSSSTSGYAMKGTDRARMTGAVIGKALQSMSGATAVIEVLVSLQ